MRTVEGYIRFWERNQPEGRLAGVSVAAVGDIMLSRDVGKKVEEHDAHFPFAKIKNVLSDTEVLLGNLEGPISRRGKPSPFTQSNFRADPAVVEGLKSVGLKVLSLANNHIYDYGGEAVADTLRVLRRQGIHTVGVGRSFEEARRPAIISTGKVKIAFLAYTSAHNATDPAHDYVAAPLHMKWLKEDIERAKSEADICIVSAHFGYEGVEFPPPQCRKQARAMIEFGANLVIGHHPHVLQGIESYKGGFIAYSLGDFVFDNFELSQKRRESLILRAVCDEDGIIAVDLLPIWINDEYQPEIASEKVARDIIARVMELSGYLKDGSSDRRFWEAAGAVFLSDQKKGLIRAIKRDGIKAVFVKLRNLRPFHVRLLAASLVNRIGRMVR